MKNLKKVAALVLALVLTLAFSAVAFAEDAATYTISVKSDDTHTYSVYQILTGDLSEGILSNVVAGKNFKGTDAAAAAEAIAALGTSGQTLANSVAAYVDFDSAAFGTVSASSSLSVPAGYYLIKDNGAASGTTESYSTYVVAVANDVTITPKKAVPSFEKKVQDTNDTTGDTTGWQDSADYDIGDAVPFKLTGTVAANYDSYKTYKYSFEDEMESTLDFNSASVVVKVDGTTVDSSKYTLKTDGDHKFSVSFTNLKTAVPAAKAGSSITVEYTATLNTTAKIGEEGNVNKAKLHYSNNPNNSDGGDDDEEGETPWDNVIVFTYKVVVNKVDSEQKPLAGAAFELQKKVGDEWKTVSTTTAGEATSFTFSGLDDGTYQLVETTTPAGYNSIEPITFTVDATHKITWEGEDRTTILQTLTGSKADGTALTNNKSEGSVSTDVVNKKGAELPSTGGIGTTIFYVAGAILVLGAAVVLVAKKRMSVEG